MNLGSLVSAQVQLAQLGQVNQGNSSAATKQLLTAFNLAQLGQVDQAGSTTTASQLLAPANQRLSQQLDAANVKLSAYGQIKSAFAGANTAAASLSKAATSKTFTNNDVIAAAQAFVKAFNQAAQTVSGAISGNGKETGALTTDLRVRLARNDLAKSIADGAGLAYLQQAGITKDKNGILTLNTTMLGQALQSSSAQTKSALLTLGQQVSATTERELASNGNVGSSVNLLAKQAHMLTDQQTILQQQAAAVQTMLNQQSFLVNYATANGLAAYQSLL